MREPLILSVKGHDLAFGLDWLPLVGADPGRLARELVRRHGATHSVVPGTAPAAVGLAWLVRARARCAPLYSGAQVFALLHPRGTVATVLALGAHGWCALAAHEGAILARSDKVYAERALAESAVEDIRQAYPKIRLLGDSSEEALDLEALADASIDAVAQGARLQRAPRLWWRRPLLWWVLVLGLVVSGPQLVAMYSASAVPISTARDIERAWSQAQAAALRGHRVDGEAGTRALLGEFYALPVTLAGWHLAQANCVRQIAHWACKAEYMRVGTGANNQGLLREARSDWQLDFSTMDRAWASWSAHLTSAALDRQMLPSPAHHDKYWMSALQAIQRALHKVRVESSQPLPVLAPVGADRQPVLRPAHLSRYSTRKLQTVGPLRAANLLIPLATHIAWTKAVLAIDQKASRGQTANPLNLTLDGVLYEMQNLGCLMFKCVAGTALLMSLSCANAADPLTAPDTEVWEVQSVRELMHRDIERSLAQSREHTKPVGGMAEVPGGRQAPRLVALYGVGRTLMAEVLVGPQAFLYMRGQAHPVGFANDQAVYQLRGMNGSCIQLERAKISHSLCLHTMLGARRP